MRDEWRFFRVMFRADRRRALAWWALVALRGLLPASFALSMGTLVAAVQRGAPLGVPVGVAGTIFVLINALAPAHGALGTNLGVSVSAWLHDRLMDATVRPPGLAHLESPEHQDALAQAREVDQGITGPDIPYSTPQIGMGLVELVSGCAQALLLARYRWWAPPLLGGAWASTHVFLRSSALWRARHDPEIVDQQRRADYDYRLAVDAQPSKEVRLFGLAGLLVDGFARRRRDLLEASWRARRLRERAVVRCAVVVVGANLVLFWSLARDASAGRVPLHMLVVIATAAVGVRSLAFGEFDWWLSTAAQPVPVVLDLAGRMRPDGALATGSATAAGMPAREIRFNDVGFAYPGTTTRVLDGFNLAIPAGASLAIVGQNGAGKTTLAKLLCRLYDPQSGTVLVDGVDLRQIDVDEWRSRIAAVFQDYVRYELALRDNVAPRGAPDDTIVRALEDAGATGLAGLDTVLSRAYEGGTDLSGGQWQRVALARALCSVRLGAGLVILDEPTAQLDVRGEAEIFDRILQATRGLTTILISHRFSTVRHADRICVLERGRVVELGSHEELVALGGRYRTMFDLQASRFGEQEEEELDVPA